ncbi:MAG TPA: glycosyltransferase family 2 protein [Thermomicrobiales bacterium]|nr:glycosyltransferase family 2 protein [Thermomicrobiales bacterium]
MLNRKLSLVLPAHNEAENIEAVVRRALEVLPQVVSDFEIIVVDDGSRDETAEIVDRLATEEPRVRAVHHEVNRGYGAALTSGFTAATGDAVMFMDSDRQFDIADIRALLPYVPHYNVVAGYRIKRRDPFYRIIFAKIFGLSVWVLFGFRMRDIDCAFKVFHAEFLKGIELTTPGALINTELLIRMRQRGATIAQVGVQHYPRPAGESSGGSPKVVFRAMGETVRLWLRLRREPRDAAAEQPDAARPTRSFGVLAVMFVAVIALLAFRRHRRG